MYRPVGAGRIPFTKKDQFFLVVLAHLLRYLISNPNTVVFPKKVIGSEIPTGKFRQYARQLFVANNLNSNLPITDLLPLIEKTIKELSEQEQPTSFLSMSHHEVERTVEKINRILQFTIRPQAQTQIPRTPHRQSPRQLYPSLPTPSASIQPATKADDTPPGFFFLATLPLRAFSPTQWLLSGHLLRGGVGLLLDGPIGRRWRVHALTALLAYSIDPNQLQNVRTGGLNQEGIVRLTQVLTYYQEYLRASSGRSLRGKFFRWFWDPLIHPDHPNPILDRRHLVQDLITLHSKTKEQRPEEDHQAVILALTQYLAMRMGRPGADGRWEPFFILPQLPTPAIHRGINALTLGFWSWMRSGVSSLLIWARLQGPAAVLGGTAGSIAGGAVGVASGVQTGAALGSALGPVGSTIGGFFGGLLGGVGGSFLGVPLGGTLGWFGYQVFSSFRLFGRFPSHIAGSALNTVGNIALGGTARAGLGRSLSGIGTAASMAAGRLLSGLFTASMTNPWVVGGIVIGTIAAISVKVIFDQLTIGGSFVPHQIGGGDIQLAGSFPGIPGLGGMGGCTLSREAVTTSIPDETLATFVAKKGADYLDDAKVQKIIQLAKAQSLNTAILFGIWYKESSFSRNPKMLLGADFGCGFPDVGAPACLRPTNFEESLQCVLNSNTGGICNLASSLAKTGDFKAWMTAYTPAFYRPDGVDGYKNFFTVYNDIVREVSDTTLRSKLTPECPDGKYIAAKYQGFPILPTDRGIHLSQCFLGGVGTQCTHKGGPGWHGLDIGAPIGTPVYTVVSGKVIKTEQRGHNSNFWTLFQGDDGTILWYGHTLPLAPHGAQLEQGQQIGAVGYYLHPSDSHLHFEIERGGTPVNPCDILDCKQYTYAFGVCSAGCPVK